MNLQHQTLLVILRGHGVNESLVTKSNSATPGFIKSEFPVKDLLYVAFFLMVCRLRAMDFTLQP